MIWALIFLVMIAACLGVWQYLKSSDTGSTAVILSDGEKLYRIDLSKVKEAYEITVETERGSNTVLVEPGAISVIEADCPDKVCIHQGKISTGGVPIVCMPNRLYIMIEGGELDA